MITVCNQIKDKLLPRSGGFTFKKFFVAHDRCAMKVGTDAVLLGAWVELGQAQRLLDIGCGSGLIALMLAQRSSDDVLIDAVELDEMAAAQANDNVQDSPWAHRIQVHAQDIHHFALRHSHCFDLIVSNPPYFEPAVACRDQARTHARYTETLTHHALLDCAALIISEKGHFCVVLPYSIGEVFERDAHQRGWHTARRLNIRDRADTLRHRILLSLTRRPVKQQEKELIIKRPDGSYSNDFRQLITNFYLNY